MGNTILDSGSRTEFESGAIRDIQEGKGRCDLMPLDVVAALLNSEEINCISKFKNSGDISYLYDALRYNSTGDYGVLVYMMLDVAKHFEEGAKKYGENNWQKGIPLHSYMDSAIRHYLKHQVKIKDEPHDRAFVWNILCAIWTVKNKPELDDFTVRKDENNAGN